MFNLIQISLYYAAHDWLLCSVYRVYLVLVSSNPYALPWALQEVRCRPIAVQFHGYNPYLED